MKIQIIVDIDIKIEEDHNIVAETITTNLKEYLTKYLKNIEHNLVVQTRVG